MERKTDKLGRIFAKIMPNPNVWTAASLIFAAFGSWDLFKNNLLAGLVLFLVAGIFDAIDGAVARISQKETALGAFLDGIIDRYVEMLLYLGLLLYITGLKTEFFLPNVVWICFLIFGALMPTYIRAYADHRKLITDSAKLDKMGGILPRPMRLGLIYLGMFLGLFFPNVLIYFIASAAILANLTAFQRIYFVVKS